MRDSSRLILSFALSKWPNEHRAKLLQYLPDAERREMENLPAVKTPLIYERFSFDWLLDYVHYSWFLPTLKAYSKKEASYFVAALGTEKMLSFSKAGLPPTKTALSKAGEDYLRRHLLESLTGSKSHLLPREYLPESELNILANFSKNELILLIDYLSLYDLAAEIRQIVETKILKKIYSFLTEDQKKFIKSIMMNKEAISFARIGLDRFDGNEENFRNLLHRRGLIRLGIALSTQHPDLIWYITHVLDIGRGSALAKGSKKGVSAQAQAAIAHNIMELLPLIHKT